MSVTELRVHGVGGAGPDALLGTTAYRQVWGDRIAGFFAADTEQRGRRVEAYCWGGMTSLSSTRVLWLLLFPFMLANLAGWTCSARTRADRWAFAAHRACGRLAALGITLNLLLIVAMATMDLWAFQFGRRAEPSGSFWKETAYHLVHARTAGRRVVIGAGAVVAVLVVLWLLSRRARNRYEEIPPVRAGDPARAGSAAALPDGVTDPRFFDGAHTVRRLGLLHVGAGLSWLAFVMACVAGTASPMTVVAAALLGCTIALLACETAGDRVVVPLVVAASLAVCATAVVLWHAEVGPDETFPNVQNLRHASIATLALIVALVTVRMPALALIALLRGAGVARGAARAVMPRPTRRWVGAPEVVALLGMLSINIAGVGGLVGLKKALGPGVEVFPVVDHVVPMLVLGPVAVFVLFPLVQLIRYVLAGFRQGPAVVEAEYAGRMAASPPPPPPWDAWRCSALPNAATCAGERRRRMRWVRAAARGRELAGFAYDARHLLNGLLSIAVLTLGVAAVMIRLDSARKFPGPLLPDVINDFALTVAGLIPVAGVALLRWGWGRRDARRWLGVLWDVGTFWPRSFHPFAPPCYAERAVPDLQRRIRWLHDSGERVLVVAHSQGSILAAVALAQQATGDPALATFGSPLMKLYGWAFPAYIGSGVVDRLRRWRNFSYPTDYIGGPVGRDGVDVPLPDPDSGWYTAGEPMPGMRRHTGYWSDEAMWREIDRLVEQSPPITEGMPAPAAGGSSASITARRRSP